MKNIDSYRASLRARERRSETNQKHRRNHARHVARRLASWLKERHGVRRVILFGSMAEDAPLGPRSDIDLAVEGLEKDRYFEAVGRIQSKATPFSVDLVRVEDAPGSLKQVIRKASEEL